MVICAECAPEILYYSRKQLPIQDEFNAERLTGSLGNVLSELLDIVRTKGKRPEVVHVSLCAPWQVSQTRSVVQKSERPIKYTKELVRKIFETEEKEFLSDHFKDQDVEIVERKILSVRLNGYESREPVGKSAQNIKISFYLSAAPTPLIKLLTKHITSAYHHENIVFHTFPLMALISANELVRGRTSTYLLVDIGGEVSEASFVKDGSAIESFTFPLGAHSIVREVAKVFKSNLADSSSLTEAYYQGRTTSDIKRKMDQVLADVTLKWSAYTRGILEKISNVEILPQTLVLVGNPRTTELLVKVLNEKEISDLFSAQSDKVIYSVTPADLSSSWKKTPGSGGVDVFLASEIFAIDLIKQLPYN